MARRTLTEFAESQQSQKGHAALRAALDSWFHEVSRADWKSMADVKQRYAHASIINAERIVFNIKGNEYRLIVAVNFAKSAVWIKWIGSHREYDSIDAARMEHE
ncbi:MAG: type II toxin-antitoxin system HigB family toxin [Rhizobiaceae bacterium]|nr:type II toxin-antitoxin system HigB family toxin [Rhizobiaceae bacterium]